MPNDTYQSIEMKLKDHKKFKGNSARGFWDSGTFRVYSYETQIATYSYATKEVWIDPEWHSVTTSRLTNIIRKVWK